MRKTGAGNGAKCQEQWSRSYVLSGAAVATNGLKSGLWGTKNVGITVIRGHLEGHKNYIKICSKFVVLAFMVQDDWNKNVCHRLANGGKP